MKEPKECPYCGGRAYIDFRFGKPYIECFHSRKCAMSPNTWLMSDEPIGKQIEAWNRRSSNGQAD